VSAVNTADASERRAYDQVLDQVSKPLMHAIRGQVEFASVQTAYPDGVVSNFNFTAQEVARPIWRYPDLGPHVVYLSNVIARTISEQMREESKYLRRHYRARQALKEIVEMPDHQADRLLRSMEQGDAGAGTAWYLGSHYRYSESGLYAGLAPARSASLHPWRRMATGSTCFIAIIVSVARQSMLRFS
jgi:hypothetical protein